MAHEKYCGECEIAFKVRHEADEDRFLVMFCPFCGEEIDWRDSPPLYSTEDEE